MDWVLFGATAMFGSYPKCVKARLVFITWHAALLQQTLGNAECA